MSKFSQLKEKLSHRKGVTNPGGLARYIGEKKYTKAGFRRKQRQGLLRHR